MEAAAYYLVMLIAGGLMGTLALIRPPWCPWLTFAFLVVVGVTAIGFGALKYGATALIAAGALYYFRDDHWDYVFAVYLLVGVTLSALVIGSFLFAAISVAASLGIFFARSHAPRIVGTYLVAYGAWMAILSVWRLG